MQPSAIHATFKEWAIDPTYAWDALELELDIPICEFVQDRDHLRAILARCARTLIDMAVDDTTPLWSSYFTWAVHIIDSKMPITHTEGTLLLGEAARWYRTNDRPDYLYVVQRLLTNRIIHPQEKETT